MGQTTLRTAIVVESLPRGRWLAWPFADPTLAQFGRPEDDPRLIMALVLPEHLKTLPGAARARFATPPGTRIGSAPVTLTRATLPQRLNRDVTLVVPWVLTPYGRDLWLHVPILKLTYRLDPPNAAHPDLDTTIQETVASEVTRVVTATEPSPDAFASLFPTLSQRLEWLDITLEPETGRDPRGATAKAIQAEEANGLLLTVASPMHADRRIAERPPLVARPRELEAFDRLIAAHSVLVHGPELVGKTALVEGWLQARLASPEARDPRALPPVLVYATSGARLMAGMSLLGQWQERLRRVLEAAHRLGAILWIEHLGELVGESGHGDELVGALRPWLEHGKVRVVTELRDDEVDRLERRFPPLMATFRRVRLTPLGTAETLQVLDARRRHQAESEPRRPAYDVRALPEIVALSGRYQSSLSLPGAAVRLADDLRNLAEGSPALPGLLAAADAELAVDRKGAIAPLDQVAVQRLYAAWTGLPRWLVDDTLAYDVDATRATLGAKVIGQDAAVRAVAESLAVVKTRLGARGKPLATFLFAGPTGVGKTELARALAVHLFGSEQRMVRFDMSEFMDGAAAERLIRGADGQRDGLLTRQLRKMPLVVLLLDEIEKAHRGVFDLLLQALGDGRLTDASGRTASLEGAIVILTSNLGASDKVRKIGLVQADADALATHYLAAVRKHFAPEFVNRLERVIPFAALGPEALRKIVRLQVERVRRRRGLRHIELGVSDGALDLIAEEGTTAAYGARALRRAVDRLLVDPLAKTIAYHPAGCVAKIAVDRAPDVRTLAFVVTARPPTPWFLTPRARAGSLRRDARKILTSDAVREVHDRLEHIDADLLRGARAGPLLAERARLEGLLEPFRAAVAELEQLEELAYLEARSGAGESDAVFAEIALAERRMNALHGQVFELLLAIEPRRDVALVALTELDDHRGFDAWLLPLLEVAESRRWTVRAWIEGERGPGWPSDLRLGPPRTAAELYVRIAERPSDFRHLLLGVHGRHAGSLLACEAGLITTEREGGRAALLVKLLSLFKVSITPEELRETELAEPPATETRESMANGRPARAFVDKRFVLRAADAYLNFPGGPAEYFAAWEAFAGHHVRAFDMSLTRDRSELWESPLDDELMLKALANMADADRDREGP